MEKTDWVNDLDVKQCTNCCNNFNLIIRKHHCRICGKIFCYKCVSELTVFHTKIKSCNECNIQIQNKYLIDKDEFKNKKLIGSNELNTLCTNLREQKLYIIKLKRELNKPTLKENKSTQIEIITLDTDTQTEFTTTFCNMTTQTDTMNTSSENNILECIKNIHKKNPVTPENLKNCPTNNIQLYHKEEEIIKYKLSKIERKEHELKLKFDKLNSQEKKIKENYMNPELQNKLNLKEKTLLQKESLLNQKLIESTSKLTSLYDKEKLLEQKQQELNDKESELLAKELELEEKEEEIKRQELR